MLKFDLGFEFGDLGFDCYATVIIVDYGMFELVYD
jgi:hypothetical protein